MVDEKSDFYVNEFKIKLDESLNKLMNQQEEIFPTSVHLSLGFRKISDIPISIHQSDENKLAKCGALKSISSTPAKFLSNSNIKGADILYVDETSGNYNSDYIRKNRYACLVKTLYLPSDSVLTSIKFK